MERSPMPLISLIIIRLNLEIFLRMITYRTRLRGLLTSNDVPTVTTLPDALIISGEYDLVFNIFQKLPIASFVLLLIIRCLLKDLGNLLKAVFLCFGCKVCIFVANFEFILTCGIA